MRSSRPRSRVSRWPKRILRSVTALLFIAGLTTACAPSIHQHGAVHVLTANSDVNQVMRQYIDRGIGEAERTDAKAVVIKLDTPGGLSDQMEKIIQRIQASKVPVIVWVAPSGAKAASAGTFISNR